MTKKLLLADDSLTIQKVVGIVFANLDYKLFIADNGDTALDLARKELPDLVIADVGMPGKDGLELCREIKNDPSLASTPVLLLPGAFENFDENTATAAGADGWLTKPFESQVLINRVEELLALVPDQAVTVTPEFASAPAVETTPEPMPIEEPAVEKLEVEEPAVEKLEVEEPEIDEPEIDEPEIGEPISFEESSVNEPVSVEESTETSEDIWDSVTFEEEDLQADEDPFVSPAEGVNVPDAGAAADEPISFEEAVPITEEVSSLIEEEPEEKILDLAEDDILELDESEIIEEEPVSNVVDFSAPEPAAVSEQPDSLKSSSETVSESGQSDKFDEIQPESFEPTTPVAETVAETVAALETSAGVDVAEAQLRNLDDAELEAVVKKVAGPIIEKMAAQLLEQVVWEVVPDLAESMIKDEIRKIKEGAA